MLKSMKHLLGYQLEAKDGLMGEVKDFYFDDRRWGIRYLVVDTGNWLPGRLVLISPNSMGTPDWATQRFPIHLTKEQIENSPDINKEKPVSRQKEQQLVNYYRWPAYWGEFEPLFPAPKGLDPAPVTEEIQAALEGGERDVPGHDNPHLRSFEEVVNYSVQGVSEEIGHADDGIVEEETWTIRYVVVHVGKWFRDKKVLLSPSWIKSVDWANNQMTVDFPEEQIEYCPEYEPSTPINRKLETMMYDYFGRPVYWE